MTKIANKNITWSAIKKDLKDYSKEDLYNLIQELYTLSKDNKNFLAAKCISGDVVLQKYKDEINKYLAPSGRSKVSITKAKKVLRDYKKAAKDKLSIIDLMVHYVESGTDFLMETEHYYLPESYCKNLEIVFADSLKLIKSFDFSEISHFTKRLEYVVEDSEKISAWWYHKNLCTILQEECEELGKKR